MQAYLFGLILENLIITLILIDLPISDVSITIEGVSTVNDNKWKIINVRSFSRIFEFFYTVTDGIYEILGSQTINVISGSDNPLMIMIQITKILAIQNYIKI